MKKTLTGKKFGRLTVGLPCNTKIAMWNCKCDCGKSKQVRQYSLLSGNTKSCGCLSIQMLVERRKKYNPSETSSPEYQSWARIKSRCYNSKVANFSYYGGRGIKVCDRWRDSFENFLADMGRKPSPQHSIERINNNGNYEPSNCKWATQLEQANNKRNNVFLSSGESTLTVAQWSRKLNICPGTINWRLKRGIGAESALLPISK